MNSGVRYRFFSLSATCDTSKSRNRPLFRENSGFLQVATLRAGCDQIAFTSDDDASRRLRPTDCGQCVIQSGAAERRIPGVPRRRKRRPGFFAAAALNDTKKKPRRRQVEDPDESKRTHLFCHPDEASNASGWKDLGQRGASAAGSGSALLHPIRRRDRCAISETGTGFADERELRGNRPCVTS